MNLLKTSLLVLSLLPILVFAQQTATTYSSVNPVGAVCVYSLTADTACGQVRQGAVISEYGGVAMLDLGSQDGYFEFPPSVGEQMAGLRDFTVSVCYRVGENNPLDGNGHFLLAFSQLAENQENEGPYVAFRLNEQRFETSTGGWAHEQIVMKGGKAPRGKWVHALFRQRGRVGELFLDGQLVSRNEQMPAPADVFSAPPACCWVGKAPFHGDKYLASTLVAQLHIYQGAVTDEEVHALHAEAQRFFSSFQ